MPSVRDRIAGPTPGHMIEGPTEGSAKSLLAKVITRVGVGRIAGTTTATQDEEEWRKRLTTHFKAGAPVIQIDNLTAPLDSAALAKALTDTVWIDRLLSTNEEVHLPVRSMFLVTANNPVLSRELLRRFVRIRLNQHVERPWLQTDFRHWPLLEWVDEHYAELVWATLTLVQAWFAVGAPEYTGRSLGSYEVWARVIGGVLAAVGVDGFLANIDAFRTAADRESTVWEDFVTTWWDSWRDTPVGTADLLPLAMDTDGFDLGRGDEHARAVSLGMRLSQHRDRIIAGYQLTSVSRKHRAVQWSLEPVHLK